MILTEVKCVKSDYYFFPSYAGESSAGILCFSFRHCIMELVDKLNMVQGTAVGMTRDLETYKKVQGIGILSVEEVRIGRHNRDV